MVTKEVLKFAVGAEHPELSAAWNKLAENWHLKQLYRQMYYQFPQLALTWDGKDQSILPVRTWLCLRRKVNDAMANSQDGTSYGRVWVPRARYRTDFSAIPHV